jgi:hypothetical protein
VEPYNQENSQIWIPDIELVNADESLDTSMSTKPALVEHTGDVFWSRPGKLKALCKFSGLSTFPYDVLKCTLEFGPWALHKDKQDISLQGSGVSWVGTCENEDGADSCEGSNQEGSPTAGSRFQDYRVKDISVRQHDVVYSSTGRVLTYQYFLYTVEMQRSRTFYTLKLVVPQVAFNLISWITYFMDPNVGERLGFGITLILAVTAQDFVAAQFMPVCDDVLLLNFITWICQAFVSFALLESGLVLFLYHLNLLYWTDLLPRCVRRVYKKQVAVYNFEGEQDVAFLLEWPSMNAMKSTVNTMKRGGTAIFRAMSRSSSRVEAKDSPALQPTSVVVKDEEPGMTNGKSPAPPDTSLSQPSLSQQSGAERPATPGVSRRGFNLLDVHGNLTRERETLYIKIFSALDHNCDGSLSNTEVDTFLKLLIGEGWVGRTDASHARVDLDADCSNSISLSEFVDFCEKTFELMNHEVADHMLERFLEVAQTWKDKATQKWMIIAIEVDKICRWLVPLMTLLSYTVLFTF